MRQWHSDLAVRDISTILKRAAGIEETPKSYHGYTNKNIRTWGLAKGDWKPISLSEKSMIKPTKIVVCWALRTSVSIGVLLCVQWDEKAEKEPFLSEIGDRFLGRSPLHAHSPARHPIKRPRWWSLFIPVDDEGIEIWEQEINGWINTRSSDFLVHWKKRGEFLQDKENEG